MCDEVEVLRGQVESLEQQLRKARGREATLLAFLFGADRRLSQARQAIETAITAEDGLDGAEGDDLITLIEDDLRKQRAATVQSDPLDEAFLTLAQSARQIRDCRREMIQHALSCPACSRGHAADCDRNATAWRTLLAAQTAEGEALDVLAQLP